MENSKLSFHTFTNEKGLQYSYSTKEYSYEEAEIAFNLSIYHENNFTTVSNGHDLFRLR